VVTLPFFASWSGTTLPVIYLAALFVTLIPTTIGGLLSAIGIAGMDRLVKANVIAKSGRAVEAAGDIDVLLLDKTGTITFGNRMAHAFEPAANVSERDLAEAAFLASLSDDTPEGKSIVELAARRFGFDSAAGAGAVFVPFTAQTRMSGVDLPDGRALRKGASDTMAKLTGGALSATVEQAVRKIASSGGTPLVVARDNDVLGVVHLKDVVKPGIRERFAELRRMGIRTVMITGDNPLTAAAIAAEAGVDDFLAEATPEAKLALIRKEQAEGRLVAMCGDGSNDAPALAQADVGVGQPDRPRQRSHQADRDRHGRQAAPDLARRADDLLDRQRRRQVFRHPAGAVRHRLSGPGGARRDGAGQPAIGDPVGDHLQRARHRCADPDRVEGRALRPGFGRITARPQPARLRARRPHRSVHRHQGDRPDRRPAPPRLRREIMTSYLRPSLVLLGLFSVLTGAAYPLAVTGVAQAVFPAKANGSPVVQDGAVIGSALIGQSFASERYFHGRPSATSAPDPQDASKTVDSPYNAANSTGSNLGPGSATLKTAITDRVAALGGGPQPADLVTASGSGLDPDLSPQAALVQVARVAKARGLPEDSLRRLVQEQVEPPMLGVLGEPRVNVLALNLALDRLAR